MVDPPPLNNEARENMKGSAVMVDTNNSVVECGNRGAILENQRTTA